MVLLFTVAHEWLHRWHGRWFRLSPERFAVVLFNLVLTLALRLAG